MRLPRLGAAWPRVAQWSTNIQENWGDPWYWASKTFRWRDTRRNGTRDGPLRGGTPSSTQSLQLSLWPPHPSQSTLLRLTLNGTPHIYITHLHTATHLHHTQMLTHACYTDTTHMNLHMHITHTQTHIHTPTSHISTHNSQSPISYT